MTAVLLAHGSPDARHGAAVEGQAALLRERGLSVITSYLDHQQPTFAQAVARIPVTDVLVPVVPLLIAQAFHATVDVPREVAATDRDDLDVRGGWLDDDVLLPALDALTPPEFAENDALILVTAGSSDSAALRADEQRAASWGRRRGVRWSAAAFASGPGPRPSEAIEAARESGVQRIHVVTAFLAPGILLDRVIADCSVHSPDSLVATPLLGTEHVTAALHAAASA